MRRKPLRGYWTFVSEDSIRTHVQRPLFTKLRLLEEMIWFNKLFLTRRTRRLHQLYRQGQT